MGCRVPSFLQRLKTGVGYSVRRYPSTVIAPLLLFLAISAIGITVVILASNATADTAQRQAYLDASATAQIITDTIQAMIQPTYSMGSFIQAHPYYPDVDQAFANLTKTLLEQVAHLSTGSYLELGPKANITQVYPVNANSSTSVGLNLLDDPGISAYIGQAPGHRLTLQGPIMLYGERVWGMISATTIFIDNVDRNETFGMPDSAPVECPGDLAPMCYYEETGSKFWGLVWSVIYFDSFIKGPTAALNSLRDKGYSYLLFTSATVDDPPLTPGFIAPNGSDATLLAQSPEDLMNDAVEVTIDVFGVGMFSPWSLLVTKSSGWVPVWKYPLLAMVIVMAAIVAVLLFILLLYMRQHQSLLYALMPRHMVQSMFQANAFDAIVKSSGSKRSDEPCMLDAGTPVERLIDMLSLLMEGKNPNMQEIVELRAAVIQGGDMLFEPQDLRGQLQLNRNLEDDVVDALVRELQGMSYEFGPSASRGTTGRPGKDKMMSFLEGRKSSCSIPDDAAFGKLSVALKYIITHEPGVGRGPANGIAHLAPLDLANISAGRSSGDRSAKSSRDALPHKARTVGKGLLPPSMLAPPILPAQSRESEMVLFASLNDMEVEETLGDDLGRRRSIVVQSHSSGLFASNDPKSCPPDQVQALLEAAYGSWTFDSFELTEATNGHPLSTMFFFLMTRTGLIKEMKLHGSTVARLALALEDGYQPNPYHNKTHAADVLQTMHTILLHTGMLVPSGQKGYCPPLTLLACFLAAAGHDIGHTGVTNDFLIQNEDQLATLYSDKSPMEHHHLAHLWTLLRNPSYNILRSLSKDERSKVRKTVIDLICATDMKTHFSILSQFSISHRLSGATGPAALAASSTPTGSLSGAPPSVPVASVAVSKVPTDDAEQMTSLQVVLKCADLGHIAESLEVHRQWVTCLEDEFFAQGDRERSLGLPISPLFDRNKPGASKSQIGFYDFVVLPLFHNFTCAFPGAKPMIDLALHTYRFWKSATPAPDSSTH